MSRIGNITAILAVLITTVLCTVESAFAQPAPPPDGPGPGTSSTPVLAHAASSGMGWWTMALIAVALVLFAVCSTALWHSYRKHHRLAHRPAVA
jgi:Na+/alanine symporter